MGDSAEEEARKEALRRAGEDYFNRVLEQAGKGREGASGSEPGTTSKSRTRQPAAQVDADMEAVGAFFEKSKLYWAGALFVVARGLSYVLMQNSLYPMQTPAFASFLHMLPVLLAVWCGSYFELLTPLAPLTASAAKGASVSAAIYGLQLLFMFGSLLPGRGSVYLLLCTMSVVPPLLEAAAAVSLERRSVALSPLQQLLLATGAVCLVVQLAFGGRRGSPFTALLLALWCAAKGAEIVWRALRADPTAAGRITDPEVVGRIKEVADEEEGLEPAAGLLLRHALPALPLLLLGLVAQEGDKILDHELNVPAATVLLLSCVTYTASACLSTYLTAAAVPPEAQLALTSLALAATIGIEAYEDRRSTSVVAILTALTGVGCSYGFHWLRLAGSLGGSGGLPLLRPAATSFAGLP